MTINPHTAAVRQLPAIRQRYEVLYRCQPRRELLYQRGKADIEEQDLVARMIDDVLELLRKQSRIDGVQYRAAAGYAVKELEMTVPIPGQCAHAIARLHAESGHQIGNPRCAPFDIGVCATMNRSVDSAGDDLTFGMNVRGVLNQ